MNGECMVRAWTDETPPDLTFFRAGNSTFVRRLVEIVRGRGLYPAPLLIHRGKHIPGRESNTFRRPRHGYEMRDPAHQRHTWKCKTIEK